MSESTKKKTINKSSKIAKGDVGKSEASNKRPTNKSFKIIKGDGSPCQWCKKTTTSTYEKTFFCSITCWDKFYGHCRQVPKKKELQNPPLLLGKYKDCKK